MSWRWHRKIVLQEATVRDAFDSRQGLDPRF